MDSYDYADDEEWPEDGSNWVGEEPAEQETSADVTDEGAAYLKLLHDEVSPDESYIYNYASIAILTDGTGTGTEV